MNAIEETQPQAEADLFQNWARQNGCKFDGISLNFSLDKGYGFASKNETIKACSELVHIPCHLLLDTKAAFSSIPALKKYGRLDAFGKFTWNVDEEYRKPRSSGLSSENSWPIVILLISENLKGKNSRFYPYLNMLPKQVDNAISMDMQVVQHMLKDTPIATNAVAENQNIDRLCTVVKDVLNQEISRDVVVWAYSMFWSRALAVPLDSEGCSWNGSLNPAMVPLIDLLNHKPGSLQRFSVKKVLSKDISEQPYVKSAHTSLKSDMMHLAVLAGQDIQPENEIFINYGNKTNVDLILHYGFFSDDAALSVQLAIPTSKVFPLTTIKSIPNGCLDAARSCAKKINCEIHGDQNRNLASDMTSVYGIKEIDWSNPEELNRLAGKRNRSNDEDDDEDWIRSLDGMGNIVSTSNEVCALEILKKACLVELACFNKLEGRSDSAEKIEESSSGFVKMAQKYVQHEIMILEHVSSSIDRLKKIIELKQSRGNDVGSDRKKSSLETVSFVKS